MKKDIFYNIADKVTSTNKKVENGIVVFFAFAIILVLVIFIINQLS